MDVGADNFRFTLDDPEKKPKSTRQPKTSELHLDSLDRYHTRDFPAYAGLTLGSNQNNAKISGSIFGTINTDSATNDCQLQTRTNMLYGYFSRVALTQFQINYRVPTVVTGYNDTLNFYIFYTGAPAGGVNLQITIPQGYYTVASMGAVLQALFRASNANLSGLTVTAPQTQATAPPASAIVPVGYTIATNTATTTLAFSIYVDASGALATAGEAVFLNFQRTARMIGANKASYGYASENIQPSFPAIPGVGTGSYPPVAVASFTMGVPNFRPTDYIDIVSKSLTNYKDTKDSNTADAIIQPIGRIWLTEYPLSGQTSAYGWPQDGMWGMSPMTFTKNWINPNWSQWSPNQAINNIDITLLDMWGNPLFWNSTFNTEWSATLTVTE